MRARLLYPLVFIAFIVLLSSITYAQTADFTIIALPDTQNEAELFPQVLNSQMLWIVKNRAALNIQMVLGEGDIVNDFSSPPQQQNADSAFQILDQAGVPYLLAIGNHDYDHATPKAGRPVSGFNQFFGPARYAGRPYYGGNFPAGSNENFFGVLNIAGADFLFLFLEFMPREESMEWAESVLRSNPDKQVIVVTHSFTFVDNTRVDACDTEDMPPGNATGDEMWERLRKYPNIIMVLSGHLTDGQAARRADLGDSGNLVNQIFANYQTLPHGGDGWLRIITFHPAANTISVRTYSPSLNQFQTDARNQFTVSYHNPHHVSGVGKLSGMVRNATSCLPIAGARVTAGGVSTVTTAKGHYSLSLPPGAYTASVTAAAGSATKTETVADSFDTDLNFFLGNGAGTLLPLSVDIIPGSANLALGGSVDFTMHVSSDGRLTEPVEFSCSGLPAGTKCSFDPAQISPSTLPAGVRITISNSGSTAAGHRNLFWGAICSMGVVMLASWRRRLRAALLGISVLFLAATMVSCSGHGTSMSHSGSFAVTVSTVSGSVSEKQTITLTLE
jgi:hypothetical protein